MRAIEEVWELFNPLWADIETADNYPAVKPLLAHYTNLDAFEGIVRHGELWLSNPLFMNDHEEMRFGMLEGNQAMLSSEAMKDACETEERYKEFLRYYNAVFDHHANKLTLDTYIGCFSLHDAEKDRDGRLSMWRAYGAEGNGIAIVFDTSRLTVVEDVPIILSRVSYGTTKERREWIAQLVESFAKHFRQHQLQGKEMEWAAFNFLLRLKMFAIFTKHKGFTDEQEWRVAYFSELDRQGKYTPMLSYHRGATGVEPKLKLKSADGVEGPGFEKLITQIITGPTASSPIALESTKRMLTCWDKPKLAELVQPSETPLRPKR